MMCVEGFSLVFNLGESSTSVTCEGGVCEPILVCFINAFYLYTFKHLNIKTKTI